MSKEVKNIPASIMGKLRQLKKELPGSTFKDVYSNYVYERFLYRLSKSPYKNNLILKGAWSIRMMGLPKTRPTQDVDFLGLLSNDLENLKRVFAEICSIKCIEDGLVFPTDNIKIEQIMENNAYPGVRIKVYVKLGEMVQVAEFDVGYGDEMYPNASLIEYKPMLNFENFSLLRYPVESIIAEKLDAMLHHGRVNSRIKDFFDIWFLLNNFEFKGEILHESISRTINKRGRTIPEDIILYDEEFVKSNSRRWKEFTQSMGSQTEFSQAVKQLSTFLMPIIDSIHTKSDFKKRWNTSGYWE